MGKQDTQQFEAPATRELARVTAVRHTRRIAVLALGGALIATGLALLVLPGPGIPMIFLGLTVLSWEFGWAKRKLFELKFKLKQLGRSGRRSRR